jgi:hypothetical protein
MTNLKFWEPAFLMLLTIPGLDLLWICNGYRELQGIWLTQHSKVSLIREIGCRKREYKRPLVLVKDSPLENKEAPAKGASLLIINSWNC